MKSFKKMKHFLTEETIYFNMEYLLTKLELLAHRTQDMHECILVY